MDLWAELQATKDTLRMTEDEVTACKREKVRFLETLTKISVIIYFLLTYDSISLDYLYKIFSYHLYDSRFIFFSVPYSRCIFSTKIAVLTIFAQQKFRLKQKIRFRNPRTKY